MINMLQELMGKADSTQEHIRREMEILRKNKKEMLEVKKHCNRNEERI